MGELAPILTQVRSASLAGDHGFSMRWLFVIRLLSQRRLAHQPADVTGARLTHTKQADVRSPRRRLARHKRAIPDNVLAPATPRRWQRRCGLPQMVCQDLASTMASPSFHRAYPASPALASKESSLPRAALSSASSWPSIAESTPGEIEGRRLVVPRRNPAYLPLSAGDATSAKSVCAELVTAG